MAGSLLPGWLSSVCADGLLSLRLVSSSRGVLGGGCVSGAQAGVGGLIGRLAWAVERMYEFYCQLESVRCAREG